MPRGVSEGVRRLAKKEEQQGTRNRFADNVVCQPAGTAETKASWFVHVTNLGRAPMRDSHLCCSLSSLSWHGRRLEISEHPKRLQRGISPRVLSVAHLHCVPGRRMFFPITAWYFAWSTSSSIRNCSHGPAGPSVRQLPSIRSTVPSGATARLEQSLGLSSHARSERSGGRPDCTTLGCAALVLQVSRFLESTLPMRSGRMIITSCSVLKYDCRMPVATSACFSVSSVGFSQGWAVRFNFVHRISSLPT